MEETDKEKKSIQNATLAVASITSFCNPFSTASLNIAVPHIGMEYHASTTSLPWIVLAFLMATVLFAVPFGRLADIYGRKTILKTGILLMCFAAFLNIFSPNMPVFLLLRVLQGIGAAMTFATNNAILVSVFPANKRGSVLGISIGAVFIGAATGPVIGGFLTHIFGWRGVFAAISAIALTAFIVAMVRSPKEDKEKTGETLSVVSVIFYMVSFGLLTYGTATLTQNPQSYLIFSAGVILVLFFVKREVQTKVPVLEVHLFKGNRLFGFSILATLFNSAAAFTVTYLLSIYLQIVRGISADISGLIMISQPIVQAVLSPFTGRLSDKKSPALIASIGMACCAGSMLLFMFLDEQTAFVYIFTGLILNGLGISFFSTPNANVVLGQVSNEEYGVATSMLSTARNYGFMIGMAIVTIVNSIIIGSTPLQNVAHILLIKSINISFLAFLILCIAGLIFSSQHNER